MEFDLSNNVARYSDAASDSESETRNGNSNTSGNGSSSPFVRNGADKHRPGIKHKFVSPTDTNPVQERARAEVYDRALSTPPRNGGRQLDNFDPSQRHQHTTYGQALPADHEQRTRQDKSSDRAVRDSRWQQSSSTSLSVFNSPTATYVWPVLQPSSQMEGRPVVYVYQNNNNTPTSNNPVNPNRLVADDSSTLLSSHSRKRRASTPSPQLRESQSTPVNGIIDPLKKFHIAEPNSSSLGRKGIFDVSQTQDHDQEVATQPIVAQVQFEHMLTESPTTSVSSSSRDETNPDAMMEPAKANWEEYAQIIKGPDGDSLYRCLWASQENGIPASCSYTSKKQLVKRHIETTHLKIKLHVCDVCGKKFPQKTSLDTHRHGHTGSKPHACKFDCSMTFKDPARRHRHMVEAHGYVPRQAKRKYAKPEKALSEPSEYESIQPWAAADLEMDA